MATAPSATDTGFCFAPTIRTQGASGRISEHRVVMAESLGRPLRRGETVHHKNADRLDNRPDNLELWVEGRTHRGSRVTDLVDDAVRILREYAPERLTT